MKSPLRILLVLILMLMSTISASHAGIVEELLALPAIQSMLGRVPELQATTQRCADAGYKLRNAKVCQQAVEASRLARMPPELRAAMANTTFAASMRELCLAVLTTPAANSYLCSELSKADASFRTLVEQQQAGQEQLRMQQNRESMDR